MKMSTNLYFTFSCLLPMFLKSFFLFFIVIWSQLFFYFLFTLFFVAFFQNCFFLFFFVVGVICGCCLVLLIFDSLVHLFHYLFGCLFLISLQVCSFLKMELFCFRMMLICFFVIDYLSKYSSFVLHLLR